MKEMRTSLERKIRHEYKRVLAFMLSFLMFFTNVGSNVSIALAANTIPAITATFRLSGEDIREAAQEAIEGGESFDLASLELSTKDATLMSKYERLLGGGDVYEIFPDMDEDAVPAGTELRAFIRINTNVEEEYQITGEEEIVFLFINSSDQRVQFYADVDGYITARVTVDGHKAAVQTPSDAAPVPERPETPEETEAPEEAETTAPEETARPDGETAAPEDGAAESETPEPDETLPEETTQAESSEADESAEAPDEMTAGEEQETSAEAEVEETGEETEAATEAESEPETEAAVEEEALVLGISRNVAAVVMAPEGEDAAEADEAVVEEEPEAETEEETETETEAETEAEIETETEMENAAGPTEPTDAADVNGDKTDAAVTAPTKAEKETTAAADDDDYFIPEDKDYYDGIELIDDVTPEEERYEEESRGGSIKGTTYNQIELGGDAYARAFKTTLNALHVDAAVEGHYSVSYTIDPLGGADIINKKNSVAEGGSLSFGVRPQIGYEIEEVTANGVSLEAVEDASASDTSAAAYYVVDGVTEDLEIEVTLAETGMHSAFYDKVTVGGVTVTAEALPGLIPDGTVLDVKEVTAELEDVIKEKVEAESDGEKEVTSVLAYDINLLYNGEKLENDWAGDNNFVTIRFTGSKIEKNSKEAETLEVLHVDTKSETSLVAENAADVTAEDLVLDDEGRDVIDVKGESSTREVDFNATHFSIYAVVGGITESKAFTSREMNVGDVLEVYSNKGNSYAYEHRWSSKNDEIVTVTDGGGWNATITARSGGTTKIIHEYYRPWEGWKSEEVTITVKELGNRYNVSWYINGTLEATTKVVEGKKPVYPGPTPAKNYNNGFSAIFVGWATGPNSKNYKSIDELPAVTSDTKYYAVFTINAYFYFLLEGKRNTSTVASDYMYAGSGTVIVPDGFNPNNTPRWYNTRYNIDDFIVSYPSDEAIRQGISTHYGGDYDAAWDYNIDWTTLTSAGSSVGYDYKTIDGKMAMHVDGALTLDKSTTAGINYLVELPNSEVLAQSRVHQKNSEFALNSTVKETGTFVTDGYSYDAVQQYNNRLYRFDGWYEDSNFMRKAPDRWKVTGIATFYARYVALETYSVKYSWDKAPAGETLPRTTSNLVPGDSYTVNAKYSVGYTVDDLDLQGQKIGFWTFSGWKLNDVIVSGTQTIGNADVELKGEWKYTALEELTVTITGKQESRTYTGEEQFLFGFDVDAPADVSVVLRSGSTAVAKGVNVGIYKMGLSENDFEVIVPDNKYSKITVEVEDGFLKITPITEELTVKITGNRGSRVYTGGEQRISGYEYSVPEGVKKTDVSVALAPG